MLATIDGMTTTMKFNGVLEGSLRGCSVMTTCDTVEAVDADDAEAQAVAAWRAVEPTLTFRPLLTLTP